MVTITLQELTKRFSGSVVLSSVDLQVPAGELFFLLGPSGCGKTTLLRHIAGFYRPDEGSIWFDDEDVTRLPAHRRGTGMVFQSYALWPHLNVAQNVAFGLEERKRPRKEIEHRVAEALDQVKLHGLGTRKIQQLSGGQQQRVALARALVIRPKCLLLDEPLSNLDARLRLEMRTEIRHIVKQHGLTAIYVTHDRDEALSMADRMAIMDGGKLVQVGAAEEIYRHPATRMVAEFIGETNFVEGRALRQSSWAGFYDVETPFGTLRGRTNDGTWQPAAGQPVVLSIRPESLTFGTVVDSSNRIPAHIVDTTYLGATVQYLIQSHGGPLMKVCETNPQEVRLPSEDEVRVMAAMNDVVILRK